MKLVLMPKQACWCESQRTLGILPACLWSELGLSVSGCETLEALALVPHTGVCSCVLGPVVARVMFWDCCGLRGVKVPCLLVGGAVSHLVSCFAWGVPALVGGGWRELGPDINTLEGVFQNGACQHQCPHGRTGSPKWLPPGSLPQCELQLPPASLGDSPRSGRGSDPGSLLPSSLVPTTDKICVRPFRMESLFPTVFWVSWK